jgi:hypothetical protein
MLTITVRLQARLRQKLLHSKCDQDPYQVLGPRKVSISSPPPSEGAMSGLASMKRKLSKIYQEREKFINSQQKIKDDVSEMTEFFPRK